MYNVKIYRFLDKEAQIRFYKNPITSKSQKIDNTVDFEIQQSKKRCVIEGSQVDLKDYLKEKDSLEDKKQRSFRSSVNRTKNKIYEYARANRWDYFLTCTLNSKKTDRYNYDVCSVQISNFFKNIKKRKAKDMKYLLVPELHEDGAYHFHALIANVKGLNFVNSGHRDKRGRIVYNLEDYNFGWTTATKVSNTFRVSNYLTQYITESLCSTLPGKKRYWSTRNLNKPEIEKIYYANKNELYQYYKSIKKLAMHSKKISIEMDDYENEINIFELKI